MINSFFFQYNYSGIIQEYFQPKIGRKKKYSAWARKTTFFIKRKRVCQTEETGANKTYLLLAALKLIKDSVFFLNTFSYFPS